MNELNIKKMAIESWCKMEAEKTFFSVYTGAFTHGFSEGIKYKRSAILSNQLS